MRQALLDSCAVDTFADMAGASEAAREAVDCGALDLMYTHVTVEELAATKDYGRRCDLLVAVIEIGRMVPVAGLVLDFSRLGQALLLDDSVAFDAIATEQTTRHHRDAMIASTAHYLDCALVTNEKDRLVKKAQAKGIEVVSPLELLAEFGFRPT